MKSSKTKKYLDWFAVGCVVVGFVGMCQPFTMVLYTYGFTVVLIGVILLNVSGHMA